MSVHRRRRETIAQFRRVSAVLLARGEHGLARRAARAYKQRMEALHV